MSSDSIYRIRKPVKKNLNLGESIKQMKTLANGIDEYHIINPTSQTVFRLADIVTIIKDMEIPELIGERQD